MNINLTLFAQLVAFVVFVIFCMKLVWPPIIAMLDERKKKIADGLAEAERGMKQQELAEQGAEKKLAEAKQQASEILGQAQKRANEIVDDAKSVAVDEGNRIKEAAHAEVEKEVNRAKEVLRSQVSTIAVAGAERILKKEINASSHQDILDDLAAQI
ncbi:MAG: F0F1 ATP synthase subunit B [Gammaproteobacteria bacterium]|nr:F0F1 ATP synthase subunit B [Gammaproteobacteria bacterium]NNC66958.1 F0F1 ATP synthase subunit B [Gammaproteobacteria bacterium]